MSGVVTKTVDRGLSVHFHVLKIQICDVVDVFGCCAIGVNAAEDHTGNMSPATFGLPGKQYLWSPADHQHSEHKMTSKFRNAYTVNVTAVELQTASGADFPGHALIIFDVQHSDKIRYPADDKLTNHDLTEAITLYYVANIDETFPAFYIFVTEKNLLKVYFIITAEYSQMQCYF